MHNIPDMNPLRRAFVLLSGGVDSSTALAIATEHMRSVGGEVHAFSMDYGQRHVKEAESAKAIAQYYGASHEIIDIRGALGKDAMLTNKDIDVPNISYADIKGVSPTYVPFRNGFMLSRLAARAQEYANAVDAALKEDAGVPDTTPFLQDLVWLYFGAHAEDAQNWAYPDCTPEFVGAMANAIYIGTYRTVRLLTPFNYSTKGQIVQRGHELGVPYALTWSCYKGEELHCGTCPTCRARKQSFEEAGIPDPTKYAA